MGNLPQDYVLTHDSIRHVLQDAIDFQYPDGGRPTRRFWTQDATYGSADIIDGALMKISQADRLNNAKNLCKEWCRAIANPDGHWARLNLAFAQRLHFHAQTSQDLAENHVQATLGLLKRLPSTPYAGFGAEDETICQNLDPRYFNTQSAPKTIQNLAVTSNFDTNTVKMVLFALTSKGDMTMGLDTYLVFLTEQLEAALHMLVKARSSAGTWLILKAFLWQAWQRSTVIHQWYLVHNKLRAGAHMGLDISMSYIGRHVKRLEASAGGRVVANTGRDTPEYMCKWAFELLRTNRAASGLDLGHFIQRYRQAFGHLPARCVPTSTQSFQQCPGQSPAQCRRFTGARIEDQSAHTGACPGRCSRLYWDEGSYRGVESGARAVSLDPADDGFLKYCRASIDTMAISHVWSHGQGGRPEKAEGSTGFNSCLHLRYSTISRLFGCDSYWMDTPCIPQDHKLRNEAIQGINRVFSTSRLTLVCDRDIMAMNVRKRDMATYECLLAALLVSDWNVRAWTLLEGFKGAENIHLLCQDDEVIPLANILKAVHSTGDIVLSSLSAAIEHLFSPKGSEDAMKPGNYHYNPSLEQSGRLLSHRHASRPGDEIVIWSLLRGKLFYNAEDFWRDQKMVYTGFLVSDAPRLSGISGLSWAPARPDLPPESDVSTQSRLFAYEGANTDLAVFSGEGLTAFWLVCDCRDASFKRAAWRYLSTHVTQIRKIVTNRVFSFDLWPSHVVELVAYHRRMCSLPAATKRKLEAIASETNVSMDAMALLQAVEVFPFSTNLPFTYRGDVQGSLLVVVERNERRNWLWRKVIVWPADVPLPPFVRQRILIE